MNPTGSWQWQIILENERWEIFIYASPLETVFKSEPRALAVYYPQEYGGKFTHSGNAAYRGEKIGEKVRLTGIVTPNLRERPMPKQFTFIMNCRCPR